MTDAGDIIGPIGSLAAIGVLAYGAKTVIDVIKDKALEQKKKSAPTPVRKPLIREPSISSDDRIDRGLSKMLGR